LNLFSSRLWRWAFGVTLVVVFGLALAPSQTQPQYFEFADKLRHMAAFATLWILGRGARLGPVRYLALGLLGYGIAIELVQGLTPDRDPSVADVVADAAGMILGALGFRALEAFRGGRSTG